MSETIILVLKILFLVVLWVASIWGYYFWKFKKEKNTLPPERPDA